VPNPFSILAEARIRDWQVRKAANEEIRAPSDGGAESLEYQLLQRIVALIDDAERAAPEERLRLEREVGQLEIRLMVTLEGQGLPLAARRIAGEIERIRAEKRATAK
jgi:hypothetical protein